MKPLTVIGLNSGTSMDGIDAAAFRITPLEQIAGSGVPKLKAEMLGSILYPFDRQFSSRLQKLIASGQASLEVICRLNFALGELFAQAALTLMKKLPLSKNDVDLIGSHGQTIWHAPASAHLWGTISSATLQLGEPAVIAARTGVPVVGDFRVQDMAFGGQGAPLVAFADEVLFGGLGKPLIILNLGGIANMTVLDNTGQAILAFDTGPGNMLIDRATQVLFQQDFDPGGKIAASGQVNEQWLLKLLSEPYFLLPPPKTTGRELFGHGYAERLIESQLDTAPQDILATLTALSTASIAAAYSQFVQPSITVETLVLGGGGEANPTLTGWLKKSWPHPVNLKRHEDFGTSTKFKEALLFALLAYTTYFGIPNNVPRCTGATRKVCLGKICRP